MRGEGRDEPADPLYVHQVANGSPPLPQRVDILIENRKLRRDARVRSATSSGGSSYCVISRSKRGLPRSGAKFRSIRSHPGERL